MPASGTAVRLTVVLAAYESRQLEPQSISPASAETVPGPVRVIVSGKEGTGENGPKEALEMAREAAGELDVRIGGGPTVVRQFLDADLIDLMHVVQVPILLGRGVRLWDGLEGVDERFDIETVSSPSGVTHLTFTHR